MPEIRLEFGDYREAGPCDCCGKQIEQTHGFLYRDEIPYAIYYAAWTEGHEFQFVDLAIGIAEWADDPDPSEVNAIGLHAGFENEAFQFRVLEPGESSWRNVRMFGSLLGRDEALQSPQIQEFFHLAGHIVEEDSHIRRFLAPGH